MAKDSPRARRIGDQIQRDLSDLIRQEVKDPRVGLVTITEVEVAADYSHAKVFFTVLGSEEQAQASLAGLNHAAGFLRGALFHRLQLRVVPQLHFVYDTSVEQGMRLTHLIEQAVAQEAPSGSEEEPGK